MPSCLGICVEKNLIKYAKMTRDKSTSIMSVNSYGVKFYDSLSETLKEIISETQSEGDSICLGLNSEDYAGIEVFSGLNAKDMRALINTEFEALCDTKNINKAALDMRYVLVKNTEKSDTYKAICIVANKVELTNIGQILGTYKLTGITSMGIGITNLFRNKAIGEEIAIINIGDDTKITVVSKSEIADLITIPIGMDEVITKLADKYNSYSRAYEACKGVNAYNDTSYIVDDETKEINDILLPTLYDLKQRIVMALEPYIENLQNIYVTGTGIAINNIDLYLQDAFNGKKCELLIPYFINKDRGNLKDMLEVNNALAVASYGLDGVDKETDFYASGGFSKAEAAKVKRQQKVTPKEMFAKAKNWIDEVDNKMKRPVHPKRKVSFDDEVEQLDQLGGAGETNKVQEPEEMYDPVNEWLLRFAIAGAVAFVSYSGVLYHTKGVIENKTALAVKAFDETEAETKKVNADRDFIVSKTSEYKLKTDKLTKILESIKTRTERSFDIPNLLSRLMFAIPADVKVTSVKVAPDKKVELSAESGKYAQLGYFVSRLKVEKILENVEMEVVSMDGTIKITVNGVLP